MDGSGMTQEMEELAFDGDEGVALTDEEADAGAREYDAAQVPATEQTATLLHRNPAAPHNQILMNPCSQAAKATAEGAAKAADEAEPNGDVVKQEKVKKTAQSHKNRTPLQSCCSQSVCVACVRAGRVVRDHGEDGRRGEHAGHENLR